MEDYIKELIRSDVRSTLNNWLQTAIDDQEWELVELALRLVQGEKEITDEVMSWEENKGLDEFL